MALKAYFTQISSGVTANGYVAVASSAVFENGTLVLDTNGYPAVAGGETVITSIDTLTTIRARLIPAFQAEFNRVTGRTDGNLIQVVWLDDRGLL